MAQIDDEIAQIREAIASGAKRVIVRSNGVTKEIDYPSIDDLFKRLVYLEKLKAGRLPNVGLATFGKGR